MSAKLRNKLFKNEDERRTGAINPEYSSRPTGHGTTTWGQEIKIVSFDVAITVSESSSAEGKAGLFVAAVGLGAKADLASGSVAVSRIKFEVPIALPDTNVE